MPDVLSDTGKYELHRPTREKLARLSGIVLSHPDLNLEIEGHTDSTGSEAVNNPLSVDRAASTRNYLVNRGVDGRRIAIDGMGERYPIASNDTAEGRARNRRVEIFVGERAR